MSSTKTKKAAPTAAELFEQFCTAQAAEQQKRGVAVPPPPPTADDDDEDTDGGDLQAHLQWLSAARRLYTAARVKREPGPAMKRGRTEENEEENEAGKGEGEGEREEGQEEESPLVAAIAACALRTLEHGATTTTATTTTLAPGDNTMGPRVLAHCLREPFPSPAAGVPGMRAFTAAIEVTLRVGLSGAAGAQRLAPALSQARAALAGLRAAGVVQYRRGSFPAVFVLMDLCSLDVVLQRWGKLAPDSQRAALDAAVTVCGQIDGAAARACVAALGGARASRDLSALDMPVLHAGVRAMARSIPYDFPQECDAALRAVVAAMGEAYAAPTGALIFSEPVLAAAVAAAAKDDDGNDDSGGGGPDGEGVEEGSVGEMLRRHQEQRRQRAEPLVGLTRTAPAPAATTTVVRPRLGLTGASAAAAPAAAAPSARHDQCSSRYHTRFADASKHASSACRFCSACHLMEIVFSGCKTNCTWNHWPTERKIRRNLGGHPKTLSLALDRFRRMERGEVLSAHTAALP